MTLAEGVREAQRVNEAFVSANDAAAYWAEGTEDAFEEEMFYKGAGGQRQAVRLYPGRGDGMLLYMHGGGWVGGSIALNHRACRLIAQQSGWDVVSISYRLAPEHPYPAALDDCQAAFQWLYDTGYRKLALGGASAGGNLALSLALNGRIRLAGLLLFYPVTGSDFETESYQRYAEGYGLSRARMQELFVQYDPDTRRTAEICPLKTSLDRIRDATLPQTQIISAECDVLADDSRAMAQRLTEAGVDTFLHIEPGVTHGFINRGRLIPAADACLARAANYLKALP